MSRCVFKIYNLVFNTYDFQEGMSLALREMRVDQVGIRIMIKILTIAFSNEHDYHVNHCHQDQPFTVKNPKLDSNSALAKKRRAKGQPLPQLQVIIMM